MFLKQIHFIRLHLDSVQVYSEFGWTICNMEKYFLVRDGVQYPRIFPIHSRINPFYSWNFTFITQEIMNSLLKKFEGP